VSGTISRHDVNGKLRGEKSTGRCTGGLRTHRNSLTLRIRGEAQVRDASRPDKVDTHGAYPERRRFSAGRESVVRIHRRGRSRTPRNRRNGEWEHKPTLAGLIWAVVPPSPA
jgi:hypothetical protein